MMIELRIDKEIDVEQKYVMRVEDPTGWVIRATDEDALYEAIDRFVNDAEWSEKGFTAKLVEQFEKETRNESLLCFIAIFTGGAASHFLKDFTKITHIIETTGI